MQPSIKAQKAMKNMYAQVRAYDVDFKMLIDSGSEKTFLHPEVFRQFPSDVRDKLEPYWDSILTASGEYLKIHGVIEIPLKFGRQSLVHSVIVADISMSAIIGMDFLTMHDGALFPGRGDFTLNGQRVPVSCEAIPSHCCRIAVFETTVLEPNTERVIYGKIQRRDAAPEVGIVEATKSFIDRDNSIMLGKTLVDSSKQTVPLRVANLSSEPTVLYKGTNIAMLQPIDICEEDEEYDEELELSPALQDLIGIAWM